MSTSAGILAVAVLGAFVSFRYLREPQEVNGDQQSYWGVAEIQGRRSYMEDTHSHAIHSPSTFLFGVYDGHGNDNVSLYLADFLLENITSTLTTSNSNQFDTKTLEMKEILTKTFLRTNEEFKVFAKQTYGNRWARGGSTSVVAMIYKDEDTYHLSVANTGDSRGIVSADAQDSVVEMSFDHKPESPEEKARIESTGGFVTFPLYGPSRVNGILATSRAFGDFELSPQVIANPDVIDIELGSLEYNSSGKQFSVGPLLSNANSPNLILASDGLWDVYTSLEVSKIVQKMREEKKSPKEISEHLCTGAYERQSGDNVTVLIVFLDSFIIAQDEVLQCE